ncbi:hypothetical protein CXB51_008779 [Gossypium anomalum]|uniref:Uncharacterized protein n=1 Tax=Gossypium anomalum TaxID=47600 RepID=A0A8J5YW35_9ROSI|nr:hypothetical protein CXB51_008779 [Gossypium anomalum]
MLLAHKYSINSKTSKNPKPKKDPLSDNNQPRFMSYPKLRIWVSASKQEQRGSENKTGASQKAVAVIFNQLFARYGAYKFYFFFNSLLETRPLFCSVTCFHELIVHLPEVFFFLLKKLSVY